MIEPRGALCGIRVVDLTDSVSGQFAARLFADNGASVVLVEPPDGSTMRQTGPIVDDGQERMSALFAHLNRGKSSVVVDRKHRNRTIDAIASLGDVIVVDSPRDARAVSALPGLSVACIVTPFGLDGPRRHWKGGELIYQALSGTMFENGDPDREPLYGVGFRASYAAGVIAYTQAVSLLLRAQTSTRVVDVSIAEVAASMGFGRVGQYSYNGTIEGRDSKAIPRAMIRCADGWAALFIYDNRWIQSCHALGLADLAADPRFATENSRLANWAVFQAEATRLLADRTLDDVVACGQAHDVVVARSVEPAELLDEHQLRARGFWDHLGTSTPLARGLGPMFRFGRTPQLIGGQVPHIGSTTSDQVTRCWSSPRRASTNGPRQESERPLTGLRVVDLTTAWSGPMATRLLATLGADVVKIEGPHRPDDWRGPARGGVPSRYPEFDPGERPYDRNFQFNGQNHDKRGVAVDLKDDRGVHAVRRLAEGCDVLVSNFRSGTLDRLGLGYADLSTVNASIVVVEMPAYGSGGPISRHVALGPSMELMCGMASLIGYGDGKPVTTGPAYLDPIGGFNAAAATVTALFVRNSTGVGQGVEVAQREAAMHWIGEEIIAAAAMTRPAAPEGNQRPGYIVHDAFPTHGDDEWIAIAIADEERLADLCSVMAIEPAPLAAVSQIIEALRAATSRDDKHQLASRLQALGIAAAAVNNAEDLAECDFLAHRGLLQTTVHPDVGMRVSLGLPLHIDGVNMAMTRPAPTFGQHNREVLCGAAGLTDQEVDELEAEGVLATVPTR